MANRKISKKLVSTGVAVLAGVMLLVGCAGKTQSEETETVDTGTEASESVVETAAPSETSAAEETETSSETTVPEVAIELVNLEYLGILSEYEDQIRIVENDPLVDMRCCTYVDITGDDVPELIIRYNSDPENGYETGADYYMTGAMRFFTYDAVSMEAVEMLKVDRTILNAGGGFNADAIMLDNGNIIVTTGWGDEDSELWITEYAAEGNELVAVNVLYCGEFMQDTDDDYYYEYEYEFNGEDISEEEYNSIRDGYIDSFTGVICRNPFYDSDWYQEDSWVSKVLSLTDYSMKYDDLVAMLGG